MFLTILAVFIVIYYFFTTPLDKNRYHIPLKPEIKSKLRCGKLRLDEVTPRDWDDSLLSDKYKKMKKEWIEHQYYLKSRGIDLYPEN